MQQTVSTWLAVAVPFLVSAVCLSAAPPPNDSFNNRIVLTGTNVTVQGTNLNASKQNGEPDHAGNPGGRSVWWAWTAPTNGDLTITTDSSAFDTLLGIYTGTSVSALTAVASNDDHGVLVTSRVRFEAIAGTQYQIAVDGFNDGTGTGAEAGNISLTLEFVPEPIVRPDNDHFTNRIVLAMSGASATATAIGSNVHATREPGEPLHAGRDGDTSVWWSWTAPSADTVRISTAGSTFDTLLGVYTGSALSGLTEVASNDDTDPTAGIATSSVVIAVVAGQEYQVAVDGYDGAAGEVVLRIESIVPRLSDPGWSANGVFIFTLTGAAGMTNEVQSSEDLTQWTPVGTIVNTNGTAVFVDVTATNLASRFYRAILR